MLNWSPVCIHPVFTGIQNGMDENTVCIILKNFNYMQYFKKTLVLEANKLEP